MAVNDSRSMNTDLKIGATEGSYQRWAPDRGGEVELEHPRTRGADLNPKSPDAGYWAMGEEASPELPY